MSNAKLEAILARDIAQIHAKQAAEFRQKITAEPKTLVLFGAAWLGRETAQRLKRQNKNFEIVFCDNNPKAADVDGIPVLKATDAIARYGDSAIFIVTIFNGTAVLKQLEDAGCKHVVNYTIFYRAFEEALMPLCSLANPIAITQDADNIRKAFALLKDEESQQEFLEILDWHTQASYAPLPARHRQSEIYYTPDLVSRRPDERYVDCGAFDGDSIGYFMERWNHTFERIAAFEPIASNYENLLAYRETLSPDVQKKIDLYNYAVGSKNCELNFSVDGNASSAVHGARSVTVKCVVMDELLADLHPTFIKMDIEGAEPDALRGAKNILKNDAPLLTICLYHDIRHLWEIPLLIHEANPEYTLYLRRYAQDCWETVCYAIPPGR